MHTDSPRVGVEVDGGVGILTLQRPEALNALDLDMIRVLDAALAGWAQDPGVRAVVLRGAGERGLCAGGDVRSLHAQIADGHPERIEQFFRAEYALNARIAEYPLPILALADGITMGGGIGLAGHAGIRVVTERSRLAMPETRIGLTPDVGGSWLLGRAPGRLGEYLGLTGSVMTGEDAIAAGFADHLVAAADLDALVAEACEGVPPREAVRAREVAVGPGPLAAQREWIDDAFAAASVPAIIDRLRGRAEPAAHDAAAVLEAVSPTALTVTLEAVRRARELPDVRAALAQEFALVMWFGHTQPDLPEGIRAQLVDKDRMPQWNPARLGDVSPTLLGEAFGYVPDSALWD